MLNDDSMHAIQTRRIAASLTRMSFSSAARAMKSCRSSHVIPKSDGVDVTLECDLWVERLLSRITPSCGGIFVALDDAYQENYPWMHGPWRFHFVAVEPLSEAS